MKVNYLKVSIICLVTLFLSGCIGGGSGGSGINVGGNAKFDGGVWRSVDSAKTLVQVNDLLATKGKVADISNVNINRITIDPQDEKTIYLSTESNGIFYSFDGGNSWQQFGFLNRGNVRDTRVDPNNKCVIYAIAENKLYKTRNCGRDFDNVYYHQKPDVLLTALAIDNKNPNNVYVGTAEGEVLKSVDGGNSWLAIFREDRIVDIVIDPYEPRIIYVGTARKGLFKTNNGGNEWQSLGDGLRSYTGSHEYRRLVYDTASQDNLILISKFGMLKTTNGGSSWKIVELLPAHKKTNILAVGVNPKNSQEIYYITSATLVKTIDGGVTWSSRKLPYERLTTDISVNYNNPEVVYFATSRGK